MSSETPYDPEAQPPEMQNLIQIPLPKDSTHSTLTQPPPHETPSKTPPSYNDNLFLRYPLPHRLAFALTYLTLIIAFILANRLVLDYAKSKEQLVLSMSFCLGGVITALIMGVGILFFECVGDSVVGKCVVSVVIMVLGAMGSFLLGLGLVDLIGECEGG